MQFIQALDMTPNGDVEKIAITNAAISRLNATYRERAKGVLITFETNNVRWYIDGTDPDATNGHLVFANGGLTFKDPYSIKNLRMISTAAGGSVAQVTYYK